MIEVAVPLAGLGVAAILLLYGDVRRWRSAARQEQEQRVAAHLATRDAIGRERAALERIALLSTELEDQRRTSASYWKALKTAGEELADAKKRAASASELIAAHEGTIRQLQAECARLAGEVRVQGGELERRRRGHKRRDVSEPARS